jgi:hypothetical protein
MQHQAFALTPRAIPEFRVVALVPDFEWNNGQISRALTLGVSRSGRITLHYVPKFIVAPVKI